MCDIFTDHQRRSKANRYGINVACLGSVSPFDFAGLSVNDGGRHPSDDTDGHRLAGVLRVSPVDP